MATDHELKDFLRASAQSLDSLLSLTSAKMMFGEDNTDQWQRKKQTPEQKKAARMAKLDPKNWKSAADVYRERSEQARKKRKLSIDEAEPGTKDDPPTESVDKSPAHKKVKTEKPVKPAPEGKIADAEKILNQNTSKRSKKRAHKREKKELTRQRKEEQKSKQREEDDTTTSSPSTTTNTKNAKNERKLKTRPTHELASANDLSGQIPKTTSHTTALLQLETNQSIENQVDEKMDGMLEREQEKDETDGESEDEESVASEDGQMNLDMPIDGSSATSSEDLPDILSPPQESAASSVSSIQPASVPVKTSEKKPSVSRTDMNTAKSISQTEEERSEARQRLQERIDGFRTARKADDRPIRSRADLLEQRRQAEAEKKALKKEQRRKEKEEEARKQDEEIARRFSPGGSGSLLASPRSPMTELNAGFSFGRVAFEDGTSLDTNNMSLQEQRKHKGPSDAASALKAAQNKQARVAGLDETKKQDIDEKDMWLNARKRAHGERVRDDTSLLKKALKRQEKSKHKSESEWEKRQEGVRSAQESKQKKRTENLQKRRDEKAGGGKKGGTKKVKRPGFEGSFRARSGKSKQN